MSFSSPLRQYILKPAKEIYPSLQIFSIELCPDGGFVRSSVMKEAIIISAGCGQVK
jgi:hypothetical protein